MSRKAIVAKVEGVALKITSVRSLTSMKVPAQIARWYRRRRSKERNIEVKRRVRW